MTGIVVSFFNSEVFKIGQPSVLKLNLICAQEKKGCPAVDVENASKFCSSQIYVSRKTGNKHKLGNPSIPTKNFFFIKLRKTIQEK